MEINRTDDGICFTGMDAFVAGILRQITAAADSSDPAADRRLFSTPTPDDEALNEDWREYVRPELAHIFQTARETVDADLRSMAESDNEGLLEFALRIPAAHFEAWLSSLNQARLALAASHAFTEADMEQDLSPDLSKPRDLALFQVHFYGVLQEIILREWE